MPSHYQDINTVISVQSAVRKLQNKEKARWTKERFTMTIRNLLSADKVSSEEQKQLNETTM